MKRTIIYVIGLLLALPVAFVVTFLLSPFWNWLEQVSGFESIGHSGPATWCFVAIYLALLLAFLITYEMRKRKV